MNTFKPHYHRFDPLKTEVVKKFAKPQTPSFYYPQQLASIYNFPPGFNGYGQTVAFIELGGGFIQSDLNRYFASIGLKSPTVQFVSVDGATNSPSTPDSDDAEVMLDLCVTIGVANGITPIVYMAPNTINGFLNAVSQAIAHRVNVISISWGAPENYWDNSSMQNMNSLFQSAANLGITICVAAGDSGSSDGEYGTNVDFPGSSPYALCCGGTKLVTSGNSIVSETVWNDSYGATGGGFSSKFSLPTYQSGIVSSLKRGVPDVTGDADPTSGIRIICDGQMITIGGTSAVAPLWAGLIAVLNQGLGRKLGFINPLIYPLIRYSGAAINNPFHDITTGNNGNYAARRGWDACSGLGSPNGQKLFSYFETVMSQKK